MKTKLAPGRFPAAILFALLATLPLPAQSERGVIVGRVFNATSGLYLNNAKITVQGVNREAFTNEGGHYRLDNVPAGELALAAFFTGLERKIATVKVTAGQTTQQDFELTVGKAGGDVVELGAFVVAANREFNAQAIATNEQRFASDMRNVVSADEYGDIGEGNMGEFLKQVPGVDVEYAGGVVARTASVRGFPPESTIVTTDGGDVANVGYSALSRAANLDLLTMNNVARVEIFKSPTPDKPANMLGGAINVVTKTAFEQKAPRLNYRAFGTLNSKHAGQGTRPGPGYEGEMNPLQPGFELSYVMPITRNFGVTAAATYFGRHNESDLYQGTWNHSTPAAPYLTGSVRNTSPQIRSGGSIGGGVDWRISERDVVGGAFSYTEKYAAADGRVLTSALGAGAVGDATYSQSQGARGSVTMTASGADRYDRSTHGSLKFRHTGPIWRVNSNAFYSYSTSMGRAADKGKFSALSANIATLDMRLEGVGRGQSPFNTNIVARTAAGAPVDVYDSRNYTLNTVGSTQRDATGIKTGLNLDVDRSFDVGFPLQLMTGYALRRSEYDQRSPNLTWTFVGPDGITGNADNRVGLYDIQNQSYSRIEQHFGTPKTQWIDPYKLWNLFQSNPRYFREETATAIQTAATQRRKFNETIHAAYLRGDARLFSNRLLAVGGVRFEQTLNDGAGLLNDLRATLRQDANGNLLRDANGRTIPVTTDPIELARLRYKTLGGKAEGSYSGYYPSLNLRFTINEAWIARASYARSIGRPGLGSILPGTTITDPDVANPTITVSNPELKPWKADSFEVSLETYYGRNGVASVSAYRKELTGFFASVRTDATEALLNEYFLPLDYLNYDVVTQTNIDSGVRIDGLEVSVRQPLTFLPNWARGVQVNANVTLKKLTGPSAATLQDFGGSTANWGISLNRPRFAVRFNWNHRAEFRTGAIDANGLADYRAKETLVDMSAEVRLWKRLGAYFSARNLFDHNNEIDRHGPNTPGYARIRQIYHTGVFMTMGVKGEF
ncbi:MAG: TonB-dependent receptor [Verrucomicrobia bacterium]|nr:TonB-dependent receptor [Verrucomicrobiota bacterium]